MRGAQQWRLTRAQGRWTMGSRFREGNAVGDVYCGSCRSELTEPINAERRRPCPDCGALTRFYPVQLIDTLQAGDSIGAKAYAGGMSKRKGFKWDTFSGMEMSRRLGRLVHKMRL